MTSFLGLEWRSLGNWRQFLGYNDAAGEIDVISLVRMMQPGKLTSFLWLEWCSRSNWHWLLACGSGDDRGWQMPGVGRERVPVSSNTLSRDKRCTCCAMEQTWIWAIMRFFWCSGFIVTHRNPFSLQYTFFMQELRTSSLPFEKNGRCDIGQKTHFLFQCENRFSKTYQWKFFQWKTDSCFDSVLRYK